MARAAFAIVGLYGPPTVGKNYQSQLLTARGYFHFDCGVHLKAQKAVGDPRYNNVDFARGVFARDEDVVDDTLAIIERAREREFCGIILDGVPRTLRQAQLLDDALCREHRRMTVIALSASYAVLEEHRRIRIDKARLAGQAPRADDLDDAVFKGRLEKYERETPPLLNYYDTQGMVHRVNCDGNGAAVARQIAIILNLAVPLAPSIGAPG